MTTVKFTTLAERELNHWDNVHVHGPDRSKLPLPQVKAVVGYVWEMMQLKRPPCVEYRTPDDAGYIPGAAAWVSHDCLNMVVQQAATPTVTVLHELAHAVLEDPLEVMEQRSLAEREMHGPLWLANYLFLLDRLMGPLYNQFYMRSSLPAAVRAWRIPYHPTVRGKPRVDLV